MHNKILPFSTGNNIQYPVISHTGDKYKKNVYICITKAYTSFMIKKIKNKSTYKLIFLKIRLFYLLSPAPFSAPEPEAFRFADSKSSSPVLRDGVPGPTGWSILETQATFPAR